MSSGIADVMIVIRFYYEPVFGLE